MVRRGIALALLFFGMPVRPDVIFDKKTLDAVAKGTHATVKGTKIEYIDCDGKSQTLANAANYRIKRGQNCDVGVEANNKKSSGTGSGRQCVLDVNNNFPYSVSVYVNGAFAGYIKAYGGGYYPVLKGGGAVVYALASFDDGSTITFGPRQFTCANANMEWSLGP